MRRKPLQGGSLCGLRADHFSVKATLRNVPSPGDFDFSGFQNMTTIDEAKNMRSGINVEGTVERKSEVRNVNTKAGSTVDVADAMLVDNGMEIKITLWAEDANNIQNGDKIKIENGYTNEFKGEVQLGKGKFGKLEKI